jgi:hypothetical protein
MSGDVWEYVILGAVVWFLAHRIRRIAAEAPETPEVPDEQPWWDRLP